MFCPNCGANIPEGSVFCPTCGASFSSKQAPSQQTSQQTYQQASTQQTYQQAPVQQAPTQAYPSRNLSPIPDIPAALLSVICFFIPFQGLILYLAFKDFKPKSAKSYGKAALIGFLISIIPFVALIWFVVSTIIGGGFALYNYF